ncbi:Ferrochelatase HemH [Helicobacter trogontum]|uniref:Ferrochelatase n=1 Tax=Helicobacter trogontum TaxID=50960 RepID=A0ABQ0D2W3_9HELI
MQTQNKAVVLLNMGGPNNLDEVAVFLKNMFDDPCILSIKNNFFRSMLGNIIVNSRVEKSKHMYEKIGGCSPLTENTFKLIQKLQKRNPNTFYTYAMRYVPPYSLAVMQEIMQKNIHDITLFSMYPQYSSTTTYSSFSDVLLALKTLNFNPHIKTIDRCATNPLFIKAVAQSIKNTLKDRNANDFVLLLSAHSVPVSRIKKGDPYERECQECQALLQRELEKNNIIFKDIRLCYQSKVGPVKWIGPYTDATIQSLAPNNIIVYPLSFTIDNSETKYELVIQNGELAKSLGIKEYLVCECLNDSDTFVEIIESMTAYQEPQTQEEYSPLIIQDSHHHP